MEGKLNKFLVVVAAVLMSACADLSAQNENESYADQKLPQVSEVKVPSSDQAAEALSVESPDMPLKVVAPEDYPSLPVRPPYKGAYLSSLSSLAVFTDEEGCVRQFVDYGYAPLAIWENGVKWHDRQKLTIDLGPEIASMNVTIAATGPLRLTRDVPELGQDLSACPGPYVNVGPADVYAEFLGRYNKNRLFSKTKMQREKEILSQAARTLRRYHNDIFVHVIYQHSNQYTFAFTDIEKGRSILQDILAKMPEISTSTEVIQASAEAIDFYARADALSKTLYDAGIDAALRYDLTDYSDINSHVATIHIVKGTRTFDDMLSSGAVTLPDYFQIQAWEAGKTQNFNQTANAAFEKSIQARPDFNEMRELARATYAGRSNIDERLNRAATFLLGVGIDPPRVRALSEAGLNPFEAFESQGGSDWLLKRANFAKNVVFAEVVSIDGDADLGDGYHSTVTMRITDKLLSTRDVGDTFKLRHSSGRTQDGVPYQARYTIVAMGNFPGATKAGDRFLILGSPEAYTSSVKRRGSVPQGDYWAALDEPMKVIGDKDVYGDGDIVGEVGVKYNLAVILAQLEPLRLVVIR